MINIHLVARRVNNSGCKLNTVRYAIQSFSDCSQFTGDLRITKVDDLTVFNNKELNQNVRLVADTLSIYIGFFTEYRKSFRYSAAGSKNIFFFANYLEVEIQCRKIIYQLELY